MSKMRQLVVELRKAGLTLGLEAEAARSDPSRKPAVFALRRQYNNLAEQIRMDIAQDPQMRSNPQLAEEFARRLADMRSRIAIFQGKWPTINLDRDNQAFQKEAEALRASNNRDFYDWAEQILKSS